MSVESAEMVKHGINSFLATSVVFANEIATICEKVGADPRQVEKGLKSEIRIGPNAYLRPGSAFSGLTLERDIVFLNTLRKSKNIKLPLLQSLRVSNNKHKLWISKKISENFSSLNKLNISIWGLAYKANTSSLRESLIIKTCDWLLKKGANLYVHDCVIKDFPLQLKNSKKLKRLKNCLDVMEIIDILIVVTAHDEYKKQSKKVINLCKKDLVIIDPDSFLYNSFANTGIKYLTVGSK